MMGAGSTANLTIYVERYTTDGIDIGSRRKRQRYMRETGSRDATDYSHGYYEKERRYRERQEERAVKESVIDSYKRLRKV